MDSGCPLSVIALTHLYRKDTMINFCVGDLDAMAAQLRSAGISVEIDAQVCPNGRFARLYGPEGNPIEL